MAGLWFYLVTAASSINKTDCQDLRDRPFNLKFFVSFRIFFSDNTRVRIFFFVAQSIGNQNIVFGKKNITPLPSS